MERWNVQKPCETGNLRVFRATSFSLLIWACSWSFPTPQATRYPEAVLARTEGKQPFTPAETNTRYDFSLKQLFDARRGSPQGAVVRLRIEPLGEKILLVDTAARGLLLKSPGLGEKDLISAPGWIGQGSGIQTGLFRIFKALSSNGFSMAPVVAEIFSERGFPWIDGIISTEVLAPWLVQLDFRKNRMSLLPASGESPAYGLGWACRRDRHWWVVDLLMNKRPAQMLLDSGSAQTHVSNHWIDDNFPAKKKSSLKTGIWEIEIAGLPPLNVASVSEPGGEMQLLYSRHIDGVLGFDVLHHLAFGLDYRSDRIFLTR